MRRARMEPRFRVWGFGAVAIILVAVVALSGSCFLDTKSVLCEKTGLRCPDGWTCSADQQSCVRGSCGNGLIEFGEDCDDGNSVDGDGCDANCTASSCGNGIRTGMEECDGKDTPAGFSCSMFCRLEKCGNGILDPGEQCDLAMMNSDTGVCTTDCQLATCGDGRKYEGFEECDDGNQSEDDACLNNCHMARCGDDKIQMGVETCDDGNAVTEVCDYGAVSCTVCDETCHSVPGVTSVCGDGKIQYPLEQCDDGNNQLCGTCSADCQMFTFAFATGQIDVVQESQIADVNDPITPVHDTFTLNDGINLPVTFEFDKDGSVGTGNVQISLQNNDNQTMVRNKVVGAINNLGPLLLIRAFSVSSSGRTLTLKHMLSTGLGNRAIQEAVANSGFTVIGMGGGAGADCPVGIGCKSDADCASNDCIVNTITMLGVCQ